MKVSIEDLYEGIACISVSIVHDGNDCCSKNNLNTKLMIKDQCSALMKLKSKKDEYGCQWFELELQGYESIDLFETIRDVCDKFIKATKS